jgi:hypothetical protein
MLAAEPEGLMQGLHLRVLWSDEDLMEVGSRAGNDRFAGSVNFYTAHDGLQRLAETLRGFPAAIPDVRVIRLGEWAENHSVGGLELTLMCTGIRGQAMARIRMRQHGVDELGEDESVDFLTEVEPAAVDRFVGMLSRCGPRPGAEARLSLVCSP